MNVFFNSFFFAGVPKILRRETDRQLEYVSYIRHEPHPFDENYVNDDNIANYRVSALKELRFVTILYVTVGPKC
jgi:hypothetical protein